MSFKMDPRGRRTKNPRLLSNIPPGVAAPKVPEQPIPKPVRLPTVKKDDIKLIRRRKRQVIRKVRQPEVVVKTEEEKVETTPIQQDESDAQIL
jgi:hypothetical protein